jgi:hypothetical protein
VSASTRNLRLVWGIFDAGRADLKQKDKPMTDHDWGAILPIWLLVAPLAIGIFDWIATSASRARAHRADHGLTVAPTPQFAQR